MPSNVSKIAAKNSDMHTATATAVRRLTPTECERLQGFPDGWTAVTKDGSLSAHFEHTVAVTKAGPLVLTRRSVPAPAA